MEIVEKALRIAAVAHKEQLRKSDQSPYIVHPIMVARILAEHGFDDTVQAAALVHDVIEDTAVTEDQLRAELGDEIVDIVVAVSEDKNLEWEARKEAYIEAVVNASEAVKAVSVTDKIHNAQSLIHHHSLVGEAAWCVYSRPREQKLWFEQTLHDRLKEVWQHPLLGEYSNLVKKLQEL